MQTNIEFIRIARRMTSVNRMQGTPMNTTYSVTEHGAQVAVLYVGYCSELGITPDGNLIAFMLMHDILEVFTGDLLYPAKHLNDEAWDTIEKAVVVDVEKNTGVNLTAYTDTFISGEKEKEKLWKLCDMTELYCKCADELSRGNNTQELLVVLSKARGIVHQYDNEYFCQVVDLYNRDALVAIRAYEAGL